MDHSRRNSMASPCRIGAGVLQRTRQGLMLPRPAAGTPLARRRAEGLGYGILELLQIGYHPSASHPVSHCQTDVHGAFQQQWPMLRFRVGCDHNFSPCHASTGGGCMIKCQITSRWPCRLGPGGYWFTSLYQHLGASEQGH